MQNEGKCAWLSTPQPNALGTGANAKGKGSGGNGKGKGSGTSLNTGVFYGKCNWYGKEGHRSNTYEGKNNYSRERGWGRQAQNAPFIQAVELERQEAKPKNRRPKAPSIDDKYEEE